MSDWAFEVCATEDLQDTVNGYLLRGCDPDWIEWEEIPGRTEMEIRTYGTLNALSRAVSRLGRAGFGAFTYSEVEDAVEGTQYRLEAWKVTPRWRVEAWLDPASSSSDAPCPPPEAESE